MDEDKKFLGKSEENIDWSTVIRPETMDVPTDFDLESILTGKQHSKTVESWIKNYDLKRIIDLGSGKVYVRDLNGIFTIDTANDALTDL
jgi:hypothetical protein